MYSETNTDAEHVPDPLPESDQEPAPLAEDPPEPETAAVDAVRRCLDCESPLEGRYCSHCGQRDIERKIPLGELLEDLADEFIGLQARLGRTLRALVARPGFLTNEYVEGRRVRYLAPSRLYLILALGFFFLVTSFDPLDEETSAETIASTEFAAKVRESGMTRELFIKKFLERENSSLPTILLIVMIPSLALTLKLLYVGSKINYVQHLVFAFHFFSIVLLSLTPGAATGWLPDASMILYYLGFVALLGWLLIAMRTVYRQSWLMTSVKFGVMSLAFICLLAICFWIAEVWALEGMG
jgi:hypothetical protein